MVGAIIFLGVICFVLVAEVIEQDNHIKSLENRLRDLEDKQ